MTFNTPVALATGASLPIPVGWGTFEYALLASLAGLLAASAFFSGSETALFGMSQAERAHLARSAGAPGRLVDRLLADQRMLLITIMLGNMTVNALYFILTSVLMMNAAVGALGQLGLAVGFLLIIVLLGEVLPKMLATSARSKFALTVAAPLYTLDRIILPLRLFVNACIVTPLSRLTAPTQAPPQLSEQELNTLVDISGETGIIDTDEQRILREVMEMTRLRVRDVMTPRVRMIAVDETVDDATIQQTIHEYRLTKLPVYRDDPDTIVGMLHVKSYLLASDATRQVDRHITAPQFVPAVATLEQLLTHLRDTATQTAIVVDEYGGTAGIVSIEDVVEEIVGDITQTEGSDIAPPQKISAREYRIDGNTSVHDWAQTFGQRLSIPRVATVGGLITHHLGRAAQPGDRVRLGNVTLRVNDTDGARIVAVTVTLDDPTDINDGGAL